MGFNRLAACTVTFVLATLASPVEATEWFVAPGGAGAGTSAAPFARIQDGLNAAQPGDTVTVRPGRYAESIHSVRSADAELPITLRAERARGSVVVTSNGLVLRVDHPYFVAQGLVLDGQYGSADTVVVGSGANYLILRDTEVRRSTKDLIDIAGPQGVLIENCLIHHALNAAGGRTDAHGIAAGAVQDLTVRDTTIHTFSGDGLQVDPSRAAPGWNRVTIERSQIWLQPLPANENGFAAGTVPGENAVDTKAAPGRARSKLTIRDTVAWGFRGGLISNMAAFNLKENVDVEVDGVTVHDSEIAFRLRGPSPTTEGALVAVKNAIVYDVTTAFRYEDNIQNLRIWNSTLGTGVKRPFQAAAASSSGLEVRNLLVVGALPPEAAQASNLSVGLDAFVNAAVHNYQLAAGAAAIDTGVALAAVTTDRDGVPRPQGRGYDVGAYEARLLNVPARRK